MFCPPLEPYTVEKIYYRTGNMEAAIVDLLLLAEATELNSCASSPELPSTESSEIFSSLGSDQSAIEFLHTCFPGASGNKLSEAFNHCGEDIEKTLDFLLSEEYILHEFTEETQEKVTPQYDLFSEKEITTMGKSSKKKRKKIQAKKKHDRDNKDLVLEWDKLEFWHPCHWRALEARSEYALEMFPKLKLFQVVQTLINVNGDLHTGLEKLTLLEPTKISDVAEIEARKLRDIFPQYSMTRLLTWALYWPGVDLAVTKLVNSSLMKPLQSLSLDSSSKWDSFEYKDMFCPTQRASSSKLSAASFKDQTSYSFKLKEPSYTNPSLTYNELKNEIEYLKTKRAEVFHKAAYAYRQRHSKSQTGVASYYSSEGRELSARIEKTQAMAARAYVDSAGTSRKFQLDLHGLVVAEALPLVTEMVDVWYARESVRLNAGHTSKLPPFEIITGAGNHSVNGVSRLKPAVAKLLQRHGWRYEIRCYVPLKKGCLLFHASHFRSNTQNFTL